VAKLTKTIVDAAQPGGKAFFIWCGDLPGFGVRVHPSGRRAYYVDYTTAAGARRRMTIGRHGALTTEAARKIALTTLGGVLRGEDPADLRAERRKAITVKVLCADYFAACARGEILGKGGTPKKASTLASDRGRADRHIVPLLGGKRVVDLTSADLTRFVRDVTAGKTAVVEKSAKLRGKAIVVGGSGAASRTLALLGGMLTFAIGEGVITANPARGVKHQADAKRTTRLTAETYRRLGQVLAQWDDERRNDVAVRAVRLLALTGCRKGEIERLAWDEVDAAGQALRLKASKEGASVRPIGRPVVAIFAGVERTGTWVCPGRSAAAPYGGLKGAWRAITEAAELEGVTMHTLRHSFASVAGDLGYSESTIAAMLGHAAGSVTSRYVHHLDAVLIAAADRVAETIAGYLDGRAA
jgi:integrase